MYRTKFPFIIDKPPTFSEDIPFDPIDDDQKDFDATENDESGTNDNDEIVRQLMDIFPMLQQEPENEEEQSQREEAYNLIFNSILEQRRMEQGNIEQRNKVQQLFSENNEIKEKRDTKRCTSGANFIIQFSMCMHPVHLECCDHSGYFKCPVDRSLKNCLLPSIDTIPLNDKDSELMQSVVGSTKKFIEKFSNLFNSAKDPSFCVTTEFVKSISGLISTYEIRLRNISYCLDSEKTKLLPRNLFLCVWNAFRLTLIPKMDDIDEANEKKLTAFQLFVKRLIENGNLEGENKEEEFMQIVASFADFNDLNESTDPKINDWPSISYWTLKFRNVKILMI